MSEVQGENEFSEEVLSTDESSVTEEDRAEILQEIDKVVEENKITVTSELFELKPAKKGIFLPIFINILALAVIVGGFFLATWYFEQQRESLSTEAEGFLSAEGRLIAELKREAESQLQEKDNEIGQIQSQLNQIEQERADLMASMDEQVREREAELKAALDRQLALEKSRLEALGKSAEDISGQLADLEQRVTAEQEAELNAFKSEAEETLRAKEEELARNKALTEQILDEARNEREELEAKSQAREEELVAQYEEEKAALAEQATEAETRLQQVTASQEREKLVSDQIIGTYNLISQKMENGNFTAAMADLEQLKTLLYQPSINTLPNIAARRNSDLFIIDALEELAETRAAVEETKTTDSILQTANLLETARGAVVRADDAFSAGNRAEAKRLYTDALKLVPALGRAYTNLNAITTEENKQALTAGLSDGARFIEAENIDSAVSAYSTAVISAASDNVTLVRQAVDGIAKAFTSEMDRRDTANRTTISGLRRTVSAAESENTKLTAAVDTASSRITLLEDELSVEQTKVADKTAEAADLESRLAAQTAKVSDLEGELTAAENDALDLEAKLATQTAQASDLEEQLAAQTGQVTDLETELAAQKARVSALEEELAGQTAQVSDLEGELAAQKTRVSALEERLTAQTARVSDLEEQVGKQAAQVTDLQGQVSTQTDEASELEKQLAFQEESLAAWTEIADDLETQLAAESAKVSDLEEELALKTAEAADLEAKLAAEKTAAADLTAKLSSAETSIAALRTDLSEAEDRAAALQDLLSDARGEVADLEGKLETANETIAGLQGAIDDRGDAAQAAGAVDVQLASLRDAYENAVELLDPLVGSDAEDDIREAKQIFSVFFERVNDLAFPGIYAAWQEVDTAYIDLENGLAEESGRTNALNEVIRYAEYVQTGSEASFASSLAFEALAEQDLLYKRAFENIAEIGRERDLTAGETWKLAGTVSSFGAGRIQVDVGSGFSAASGSEVLVRRPSDDGTDTDIAEGVVTGLTSGTMEADLRLYLVPSTPKQDDLVFIKTALE